MKSKRKQVLQLESWSSYNNDGTSRSDFSIQLWHVCVNEVWSLFQCIWSQVAWESVAVHLQARLGKKGQTRRPHEQVGGAGCCKRGLIDIYRCFVLQLLWTQTFQDYGHWVIDIHNITHSSVVLAASVSHKDNTVLQETNDLSELCY